MFRGVIVLGSICMPLAKLHTPTPHTQTPHSYGQNFPADRHSRLAATLGEHELAAESQSAFALLPDSLMLLIACSCHEVPHSPSPCHSDLTAFSGHCIANGCCMSSLAPVCARSCSLARAMSGCMAWRPCRHVSDRKSVGRMEIDAVLPAALDDRGRICTVSTAVPRLPLKFAQM